MESVLEDNARFMRLAEKYNVKCVLIDDKYEIDIDLNEKYPEPDLPEDFIGDGGEGMSLFEKKM